MACVCDWDRQGSKEPGRTAGLEVRSQAVEHRRHDGQNSRCDLHVRLLLEVTTRVQDTGEDIENREKKIRAFLSIGLFRSPVTP